MSELTQEQLGHWKNNSATKKVKKEIDAFVDANLRNMVIGQSLDPNYNMTWKNHWMFGYLKGLMDGINGTPGGAEDE